MLSHIYSLPELLSSSELTLSAGKLVGGAELRLSTADKASAAAAAAAEDEHKKMDYVDL